MPYVIAIVPTACGIETLQYSYFLHRSLHIAIVPTACGIETREREEKSMKGTSIQIAIVPTACGIETTQVTIGSQPLQFLMNCNSTYRLRY